MDPRGFPTSLPEFQRVFPDETACSAYLERLRFPQGFLCPKCGYHGEPWRSRARSATVLRCPNCRSDISLTAGTAMQDSHTPICTWFWAAYLVTTHTPGMSALQFQRQLGLKRYETAYMLMHKLRAAMVRPARDTIGRPHPVEIDETYVGGRTRGEGRGVHHKVVVVGAVEERTRQEGEDRAAEGSEEHRGGIPVRRPIYAGRMRLQLVPDRSAKSLMGFVKANITRGTRVATDGWEGYAGLRKAGYGHDSIVMATPETNDEYLPLIHLVFSNLKTWLLGTHHGAIEHQHLQAYLNEYVFRFNRRFYPMTAFNSVLGLAAHATAPTYAELYGGWWEHSAQ